MKKILISLALMMSSLCAEQFKSELFTEGKLLYSDDFEQALDSKWWQTRTKNWQVKNGILTGAPDFKTKEEAMKALKRDHHLGLGPVIRLENLPEKFVCTLRFQYTGKEVLETRPKIDIGHHINKVFFKPGGYQLHLSEGEIFDNKKSAFKLNEWNVMTIEFTPGKLIINLNGQGQVYENKQVSLKERSEFTFKALDGGKLMVDYIRLWEGK
ncbi:hypothetical protein LNTAR_07424 [Lentisphaera araneosa HTCC2155]|uniref:3-keto-disaccharide hydrolase domain-containing protein n=1 Tax=Lentisphaera araneosa HTCC2155 TaxID=313628 RepID=A6DN20_9BACT|nr:hypothetical protein [Lentisphaera araneosa]EDM27056.1 hypothetical protein LNTAR_07424 [Lentisphaera araneosa HTCC2155]